MIDTSAWSEFRVGDYFHGVRGTSRKMQGLNDGKTPVYFIDEKDVKEIVKRYNPTKKIGDINIPELEKKLNQKRLRRF